MGKNPRFFFILIFLMAALAVYIDIPKIQLFGRTLNHPKIDLSFIKRDLEPKLGLDLSGGVQLVLSADMTDVSPDDRDNALSAAKEIVENRVNSLGVAEPVVQSAKTQDQ